MGCGVMLWGCGYVMGGAVGGGVEEVMWTGGGVYKWC